MSAINLYDIQSAYQSIEIKNAAGTALSIDGSGYLTVKGNGSFTVTATDLDIRNLASSQDSVEIKTAAGQALAIDGSGFITANVNGTVTVSATNLDIRDLAFATDSVTAYQGGAWTVEANEAGYSSWKVTNETVTNTESELMSTPLTGRLSLLIQNLGDKDVYVKEATGVSSSNGLKIPKGGYFEANLDAGANLFAITASGTNTAVRCIEYAA